MLGDYQGITIGQKEGRYPRKMGRSIVEISKNYVLILYLETNPFIGPAKTAFVMGTAHGDLEDNTASLTRRPNNRTLIIHRLV